MGDGGAGMPNPDLKFIPGRLPEGYEAVAISAEQASAPVRLCVLFRKEADPVGGSLVVLRDLLDARVYLGALVDSGGWVHQWIEIWVQGVDRLASAPAAVRGVLTNAIVDDRWALVAKSLERTDRPLLIKTGWESQPAPPAFIDPKTGGVVHPTDKQSGERWRLCRDDAVLQKAGLAPYSGTLHRYLFLPESGAEGPFVAATEGAPAGAGARVKPAAEITGGRSDLVPLNPAGGMVLARAYSPITYEAFVDLLGGSAWRGVAHGKSVLDLELTMRAGAQGAADHLTEGGLFLGQQGRHGRLLESFHLRLRALADAVAAVRSLVRDTQRPLLNVSAESFQVRLGEPARGLPYLWTARVTLTDPGDAVALPVQTSEARYYVPGRATGASVYRSESASRASQGRGTVRIREVLTERGEESVLEGTLATDERLAASKNDLVWLRVNLKAGRLDLYARLDTKAAMAAGEFRFRTVPQKLGADAAEQLRAAKGVPLTETPFEVIPLVSSPADLYSLGVLAVRTLLVDPRTSLPVALDELMSLARQLGAGHDAKVPLADRVRKVFDSDPRWLASLGPQRLSFEPMGPGAAFDLVPGALWWETLGAIARMFPGMGPDSRCADLGDARHGGLHNPLDGALEDLDALLRRTRSLIVIDWKYNREIHGVVRGFLTKIGGAPTARPVGSAR